MKLEELKKQIGDANLKFENPPVDAEPMACWWIFGCSSMCSKNCPTACTDGCSVKCQTNMSVR